MSPENNQEERQISARSRGVVVELPIQDDLPSILNVIRTSWIGAHQNVELGITEKDLVREHYHRFEGNAEGQRGKQITDPQAGIISMLARNPNGEVVGFCRANEQDESNVITGVYVLPEVQRTGVGTLLLNNVIEKLNPLKSTILRVATYNSKAIAFYGKHGFKPTELRENFQMKYSDKRIPIMEMRRNPIAS
ncbi:MAG: GNAT family N-acetyltransferase [Gammaproteobacteria bacterium]